MLRNIDIGIGHGHATHHFLPKLEHGQVGDTLSTKQIYVIGVSYIYLQMKERLKYLLKIKKIKECICC